MKVTNYQILQFFEESIKKENGEVGPAEDRSKNIPLNTESFCKDISMMIPFSLFLFRMWRLSNYESFDGAAL